MQDEVVKYFNLKMIIGHSIGGFTALYHKTHFESEGIKKIIALGSPNELVDLTAVFVKLLRFNAKTPEAYNKAFTTYFEKEQEY